MIDTIKIGDWRERAEAELREFVDYWERQNHGPHPEDFPIEMAHGEWDEQFASFTFLDGSKSAPRRGSNDV